MRAHGRRASGPRAGLSAAVGLCLGACAAPEKGGGDSGVVAYDPDSGAAGGDGGDGGGGAGGGGGDGGGGDGGGEGSSDPGGDSGVVVRGVRHLGAMTFRLVDGDEELDRCEGNAEVGVDGDVVMATFGCRWSTGAAGDGGLAGGLEGPIADGGAFDVELLVTGADVRLTGLVGDREITGEGEGSLSERSELLQVSLTAEAGGG